MADESRHDPLEARVITVSREALRADLLDLELRLTKVIVDGLSRKADTSYVQSVDGRLTQLERESIRRDSPDMERTRATADRVADMASELRERAQWGKRIEVLEAATDELERGMLNETELRALAREERATGATSQWTAFSRVASVVLLITTVVSIWLAIRAAEANGQPDSISTEVPVVVHTA